MWLEGFNINTWTDTFGDFRIKIPPREIQPGGGITGTFKLFFFVSNYKLDSATVVLQDGELQFSYGDFDDTGHMRRQKRLIKTLNILTEVSPNTIQENYNGYISVELILQAIDDRDTVYVKYPDKAEGPLAVFFFQRRDSLQDTLIIYQNNPLAANTTLVVDSISTVPKVWSTGFQFSPGFLQRGEYEVIPFFIISGQPVSVDLLKNFGEEIDKPGNDFIKVPTTRNKGILSITPKGDTNKH
ncbi:hypothetical protein H8E88_30995 [candidate division KSB1 bacterium]|nr:hypothetical protein [candidate division KSB1 bacterium]